MRQKEIQKAESLERKRTLASLILQPRLVLEEKLQLLSSLVSIRRDAEIKGRGPSGQDSTQLYFQLVKLKVPRVFLFLRAAANVVQGGQSPSQAST